MPVPSHILELQQLEVRGALSKLRELPSLALSDVGHEDSCAICLLPLDSLIKEGETTKEGSHFVEADDGALSEQMVGVVKLDSCGHIFCRKDLAEWVESRHGTCPACRRPFFEFSHFDEDEYESSDGGEYIPDDDADEDDFLTDDDGFLPTTSDFEGEDIASEVEDDADEHPSISSPPQPLPSPTSLPSEGHMQSPRNGITSPRSHTSISVYRTHPYNAAQREAARRPLRRGRFRVVDANPFAITGPRTTPQASALLSQEGHDATMFEFEDSDLPTGLLSSDEPSGRFSFGSDDFDPPQSADEAVVRVASPSHGSFSDSGQRDEVKLPRPSSPSHCGGSSPCL